MPWSASEALAFLQAAAGDPLYPAFVFLLLYGMRRGEVLSPFMVSVGLQVATLIAAVLYRAIGDQLPRTGEQWFFGVVSVLFFTAALDIIALARSVLMHGVARARGLKIRDLQAARGRDRLAR